MDNLQKATVELKNGKFKLADNAKLENLNPKALVLCAAAQCAGYTVMSLLTKDKVSLKKFEISLEGILSTPTLQPESQFRSIDVSYHIECKSIADQNIVGQAVKLAHEERCGLLAMLRKVAPVAHQISIVSTETISV